MHSPKFHRSASPMRIIAGRWRGRQLTAPVGLATRPTAERLRQALFDMLMHAPWARDCLAGARVADVFAGTGALGLEALSRGAASCVFVEQDRAALAALRSNIAACQAGDAASVLAQDALRIGAGTPFGLVFLDPPYGQDLVPRTLAALRAGTWIVPSTLIVAETARDESAPGPPEPLAERTHGAGRVTIWREG